MSLRTYKEYANEVLKTLPYSCTNGMTYKQLSCEIAKNLNLSESDLNNTRSHGNRRINQHCATLSDVIYKIKEKYNIRKIKKGKNILYWIKPTYKNIEKRAYEIYVTRGRVEGFAEQDWLQAEKEFNE
jgi:hypothetical protein